MKDLETKVPAVEEECIASDSAEEAREGNTGQKEKGAIRNFFSKPRTFFGGVFLGLILGIVGTYAFINYNPPDEKPITDSVVMKEAICQVNELATASYTYTIAEAVTDSNKFYGVTMPFTDNKFVVVCSGEVKAGVNLDSVDIDATDDAVTVKLPEPEILSNEVNPYSFEVVHEGNNFLNPFHMSDFTGWYKDHSEGMSERAKTSDVLTKAQENAQSSIRGVLDPMLAGRPLSFI